MKYHLFIYAIVFLFSLNNGAAGQEKNPCDVSSQTLRDTAKVKIGQQKKDSALYLSSCLVRKEPGVDSNYILFALAYLCDSIPENNSHGDTLNAIQNFGKALTLAPNHHVLNELGNLFFHQGIFPYDSALLYYQRSIALVPDQVIGYKELSRIYEAIADTSYKICYDLVSRMDTLLRDEEAMRQQNLFKDADMKHQEFLVAKNTFNRNLDTLSKYYMTSIVNIDTCISKSVRLKDDDITYRKIKVAMILKLNEFKAEQDYSASVPDLYILSMQTDSALRANAFFFLGTIFEKRAKLDTALTYYREAVKIDRQKVNYWEALLKAIRMNCRKYKNCVPEEEEYVLSSLIHLDPNQAAYYYRLGYLYDSLGFNSKKITLYRQAANQFGNSQDYFTDWLKNYTALRPEIDSLELFLRTYSISKGKYEQLPPEYYQALHILGFDYYKIDNFIKAGYIIEKLVSFYPKDDSLKIILASIYLQKNLMRNSLKMARRAKRQRKDFLDYKVIAYNLESKNAHLRGRWKYKKAIKQVNRLISQQQADISESATGIDIAELKNQRALIYQQMAEDLFKRKKYRRGKKFADLAKQLKSV